MPENSLRVVVRMVAGPGRGAYELLRNRGDPTDFTFVEDCEDDAALDAHLSTAHVRGALSMRLR